VFLKRADEVSRNRIGGVSESTIGKTEASYTCMCNFAMWSNVMFESGVCVGGVRAPRPRVHMLEHLSAFRLASTTRQIVP
jgi:hypothetical protein